jgi:rsbT co-antagonist protein RsbR
MGAALRASFLFGRRTGCAGHEAALAPWGEYRLHVCNRRILSLWQIYILQPLIYASGKALVLLQLKRNFMAQEQVKAVNRDSVRIADIILKHEADILEEWVILQRNSTASRRDLVSDEALKAQSRRFLQMFIQAAQYSLVATDDTNMGPVKESLSEISRSRTKQGFSSSETASFIFSLKQPLFDRLRKELSKDPVALVNSIWSLTQLLDNLGLFTTEIYQKTREEVILRQQQEMLELSTPVVRLWDGVLALPLIGTLDSARTQVVMETLLQEIVSTGASIAIIDITGVPTVDTLVAQHLLKTVSAARLMGADCIISGIRPQIAQTIVHLGVELNNVITKSTLADAFVIAMRRLNYVVSRGSKTANAA